MTRRAGLVALLADGELHSGEVLARALGVTRAAIAKQVQSLAGWGLEVEAVARRGYRLGQPLEPIDAAALAARLAPETRARCESLELHEELASTNSHLLAAPAPAPGRFRACLAEYQSAGRGRRGRAWLAPFGSGICLSFAWQYDASPGDLGTLSLATGVAVLRALGRHGVDGLALKWPNDIQRHGGKLGGILSELRFEAAGPAHVVIGIGLNVRLPDAFAAQVALGGGVPPADLADLGPPSRTALAATLLDSLTAAAARFGADGFAPFAAEWRAADALLDRPVRVHGAGTGAARDGVARGIDARGALRVEFAGGVESLTAGDVTLRVAA
jgi:BirA family biotin operon repressor/biotin-[acetyl-CoA-carboxylase] ligase